jgi:putative ABC transport system substrate-binding protein
MKRRDLVLLGGAMVPARTPHAQQKPVPVIGFLGAMLSDNPATIRNLAGFREGLSEAGYIEGRNVAIEYRWAEAHYDRLPALAADLLGRKVDVIVATGGIPSVMAARSATSTIPIVFLADSTIVTAGLVNSLARPGGNLTGFMVFGHELTPKRLELLSELVP